MPEREDLDLFGPLTAPEQDQELKDQAQDRTDQNTSSEDARYATMPGHKPAAQQRRSGFGTPQPGPRRRTAGGSPPE